MEVQNALQLLRVITDYITKTSLNSHAIFECFRAVYQWLHTDSQSNPLVAAKARKVLIHLVNSLTARTELGGPLSAAYPPGNGDYYTNMEFRPFFWKSVVNLVQSAWAELNPRVVPKTKTPTPP